MSFLSLFLLLLVWVAAIVIFTTKFKLHPFLALLICGLGFGLTSGGSPTDVIATINTGFGNTLSSIGIVIVLGTSLGIFLEQAGGAEAIARGVIKLVGQKHIAFALSVVGYLVGIPVFSDTGFIILSPLNKALARKLKTTVATGAIALSLGIFATHTMVPPTPGPIAAAAIMDANLAKVIIFGLIASFVAMIVGWLFATKVASKVYVSPDPVENNTPVSKQVSPEPQTDVLQNGHQVNSFIAFLPIFLPILLIVLGSITTFPSQPFGDGDFASTLQFFGQPVMALAVGFLSTLLMLKRINTTLFSMEGWVGKAIVASGNILVITGAGGAFGAIIQSSGIADSLSDVISFHSPLGILLPFAIAVAIKTAQGSATVAIITTAGIIAPLLGTLGLDGDSARALTVVAIGAGALIVSHANDSHFWAVTQFSGMSIGQGYRLQTVGTLLTGSCAMIAVIIMSFFI